MQILRRQKYEKEACCVINFRWQTQVRQSDNLAISFMTHFNDFLQQVGRHKVLIVLACLSCTLLAVGYGIFKNSTPVFQTRAEIYPAFIFKTTIEPWRLNPCELTKRSLNSEHFQSQVIQYADRILKLSIDEKDYARQIQFHETRAHTIILTVSAHSANQAEAIMDFILEQLESVFWHYTSTVFLERGGYRNVDIAEYENVTDTIPDNYLDIYAKEGAQFLIYDVISEPTTKKLPFPTGKCGILTAILSLCATLAFIFLFNGLKKAEE